MTLDERNQNNFFHKKLKGYIFDNILCIFMSEQVYFML